MKNLVITFSVVFILILACIGRAEMLFHKGVKTADVSLIKDAEHLNPLSSAYFYGEYRLDHNVDALVHAIRLEPTKAAYHMYYGLALLELSPRTKLTDQEAVTEICRGAQLKSYSPVFRSACEDYKAIIPIPLSI